ncbi:hypothetical protein GCM10007049_24920 [Echinicola pacifica]|uniref:Uncharacterized protein n=1 Tax=Echinicola pacifica TaxID=346377 RepID=A0A918Q4N5_9BACT|nr:hypothetical protein [Echinicola pacifica]GGZ30989.1 hypothetical protein GCM10007049_24920 [Echinicola pacifica]
MKTSYLDYYKMILKKVSFNRALLKKEYFKAIRSLSKNEADQLKEWMDRETGSKVKSPDLEEPQLVYQEVNTMGTRSN